MTSRRAPRVLELTLGPDLSETSSGMGWFHHESAPLFRLERALERAASDLRLSGVVVHLHELSVGWAKAEALHRRLLAVRRAGKLTVAVATSLSNASYLVASAAELVLLQPSSLLAIQSLSSESLFLADLLGWLGVRPELDHVGEFKTAGEPFTRRQSSEEHRVEVDAILADFEERLVELVADARRLTRDEATSAFREGPLLPEEATERRLVDRLEGEEGLDALLEERLGAKPRRISTERYVRRPPWWARLWRIRRKRVAVVHAVGVVAMGEGRISRRRSSVMSARELVETLRGLKDDGRVAAVVLRVESPGGGAVASDVIRAELAALAAAKPVVVSMSDVAASGGYFIATAAHAVVAEAMSLTGSIGVVGGKMHLGPLLDRLGIHRETRSRGENAGFYSALRGFTPRERERHLYLLTHFYEKRFLPAVAEGRGLTLAVARLSRSASWTFSVGLARPSSSRASARVSTGRRPP